MSFTVRIRQAGRSIEVEMGDTILAAALAQGIDYPHGCRSGNCGACKSRLIAGDVEMSPYSEFALTEAEKDEGLILACRAVPWEDGDVAWLEEEEIVSHPSRRLTCAVTAIEPLTPEIHRLCLRIEGGGPFSFTAGQYAAVAFDGHPPRDYSMASLPGGDRLEFHVRDMGHGASHHVAHGLAVGDRVRVEGPHGTAHWREGHRGPILAIAGGSGLAPVGAIVQAALAAGAAQPIHLYIGARDERDLYGVEAFEVLAVAHPNLTVVPVLSEPSGPTGRRTGYVGAVAAADFEDLDGAKAYLAGPPAMVEATVPLLEAKGLRRADIHADAFYTEADKAALGAAS